MSVCFDWTTAEAAAECCELGDTDPTPLDAPVTAASELLNLLSGSLYPGICEQTVRPCANPRICEGPWGRWSGSIWVNDTFIGSGYPRAHGGCGCTPLDRVPLAGNALDVLEVTIDGDVVDPVTYQLDEGMWLTRVRDPADLDTALYWPSCQAMDKPLSAEGTFGISYEFGREPSAAGVLAANELACAIHRTCEANSPEDCPLPTGITRIERLGITIDLEAFRGWGQDENGIWRTGLAMVDAFLNAVNPSGRRMTRAQVWSPGMFKYPRPVPQTGS